jgi:hypothetical protein
LLVWPLNALQLCASLYPLFSGLCRHRARAFFGDHVVPGRGLSMTKRWN